MYTRFLNDTDYLENGAISRDHFEQMTYDHEDVVKGAEEDAESSILDYLGGKYEVEKELDIGKSITDYDKRITYPPGKYFYKYDSTNKKDVIYRTLRTVSGYKKPMLDVYWEIYTDTDPQAEYGEYSQLANYSPDTVVSFGTAYYICRAYNGPDFDEIRIPGMEGWAEAETDGQWTANVEREVGSVVTWGGNFYALLSTEGIDLTVNPYDASDKIWGLIGGYTPDYSYEFKIDEYVVYGGRVFYPLMNVNADALKENYNIIRDDPRNENLKKHMVRLAIYELFKKVSPNNISSVRVSDYDASLAWLRDAMHYKINPHIARVVDEDTPAQGGVAIATFMRDYDPEKNVWQT